MGFQKVRAIQPVNHNNKIRIPGVVMGENAQDFVVSDLQAAALVAAGVVTSLGVAGEEATQAAQLDMRVGGVTGKVLGLGQKSDFAVRMSSDAIKGRRLLSKMPFRRMKSVAMSADHTSHAQFTLECPADGMRIVLWNCTGADIVNVKALIGVQQSCGAPASITTPNVIGGPIPLTLNGSSTFTMAGSPGKDVPTVLDFVGSLSVARTDRPDGLPLHVLRVEIPLAGNANRPAWYDDALGAGHATENLTSAPYGRILRLRKMDGLFATTGAASGFNTGTWAGDVVPFTVQYVPRMREGRTLLVAGNSIDEGAGATVHNFGWSHELQAMISTQEAPVEICNLANGGDGSTGDAADAESLLDIIQPTACYSPSFNVNDISTTINATLINNMRYYAGRVRAACEKRGIRYLTSTGIPTNFAVRPFGATDSLRIAYNGELLAFLGDACIDFANAMRGPVDVNGQETMLVTADGIHPPTVGYRDYMAPTAAPVVRAALALPA